MELDNLKIPTMKEYVPVKFLEIEKLIPTEFKECCGRYIPTNFMKIKKYIPIKFEIIELPIIISQKHINQTKNPFYKDN